VHAVGGEEIGLLDRDRADAGDGLERGAEARGGALGGADDGPVGQGARHFGGAVGAVGAKAVGVLFVEEGVDAPDDLVGEGGHARSFGCGCRHAVGS